MTRDELVAKAKELQARSENAKKGLVALARMLVPLLKDQKLDRVADELGAKLFEIDVVEEESRALLTDNSDAVSAIMVEHILRSMR